MSVAHGVPDLAYRTGEAIGGRYVVLELLGKGGFGVVYHVRNKDDGRELALKTFRDEYILDPQIKLQFRKEALTWIAIGRHSFVLQAEAVHEFDRRLFVAMEYIRPDENGLVTLYDHIGFHGRKLSDRLIGTWAIEFCHGMAHAYEKGVKAHRDIKPQNILVGAGAFVKISDFGLAASIQNVDLPSVQLRSFGLSTFLVQGNTICGTLGYIAPEIFAGDTSSVRSDIYSFGAVLWQLCAGTTKPPFWNILTPLPDAQTIYARLIRSPIPPVQSLFWEIIQRCLHPDPSRRYQNFDEVKDAIKNVIRRSGDIPFDFMVNTAASFADLVNRGASLRTLGRFAEALASYEAAIELQPANAAVWVNKGNVLSSMERRGEALAAYDRAVQLDPDYQPAWFNKGLELQKSGDHPRAIQCFERVVELNPSHGAAWRRKGRSLVDTRQYQNAKACYQKALDSNPADDIAYSYMGELFRVIGRKSEALVWYDRAIKANPKRPSAWTGKAEVLIDLSRYDDAICSLNAALTFDPEDFASLNMKAVTLCRCGRQREAIPIFDRLLQTEATGLDVLWTNKGIALAELGEWREALVCCERAIAVNANYAPARKQKEWLIRRSFPLSAPSSD
jgi:tetratricopeptide (TPR) repeat protein